MTLGAPEWLWGYVVVALLGAVFLWNEGKREEQLRKLVAARLLGNLTWSMSAARRRWKYGLMLAGLACAVAALTQPRAGYEIVETHLQGLDVMMAVDTSKSMLSQDVQPDRLTRAKYAAEDLLDLLEGDRVGLVAFAGTSFVQAPLTVDYSAVLASLTDLDTNTIPRGGTNIASAIRQAGAAFGRGEGSHRALILFTDGEELEDSALEAAKEAKGKFRIYTVGVGTAEGSLIPAPTGDGGGTEFVKDAQGQYVKSKLDEERLKAIAAETGGFYVHLDNGPAVAKAIYEQGLKRMQEHEIEARQMKPIERYEWPLAAGIVLLAASALVRERRRTPGGAVARKGARRAAAKTAKAPVTAGAAALLLLLLTAGRSWGVNEGVTLYQEKNYKGAYDVFEHQLERNPASGGLEFDRGTAAYKGGDYEKALEAFGKALSSQDPALREQAEYNLGNTLVERGALQQEKEDKIKQWTGALEHYGQALKANPNDANAKYNQELVKRMIEELKKQQPPQQKENPKNKNQKDEQKQKQQDQQQSQQQQQQNQQQNQQQQAQNQQSQQQQQQQNQQQQAQEGDQNKQNQQAKQEKGGKQEQGGGEEQNKDEQNQTAQQNGTGPSPSPSPTPENGPGELKEQPQQQNPQQAENEAAASGTTEQEKEMTPSQAKALIDSMRGEDEHVSLYDRNQNTQEPVYKDW